MNGDIWAIVGHVIGTIVVVILALMLIYGGVLPSVGFV